MSTRSLIWQEQGDGSFKGIYCHNDGYIKGVGQTLLKYYNDFDRLTKLLELGSLSSLEKYIDPLPNGAHRKFVFNPTYKEVYTFSNEHIFDNPQEDVCVAYHRDRGETLDIFYEPNLDKLIKGSEHTWAEYVYIFRTNKWYVIQLDKGRNLELLENVYEQEKYKN